MEKADYSLMDNINLRMKSNNFFTNKESKFLMTFLIEILLNLKSKINLVHRDIKP